jgi:hypothetical protein
MLLCDLKESLQAQPYVRVPNCFDRELLKKLKGHILVLNRGKDKYGDFINYFEKVFQF